MKRFFLLLALVIGSCACEEKPAPTPTPIPEPDPDPIPVEEAVRVPFQSEITHVQPMTGIVLWTTSGSTKREYVQLEYSYMLYNDVCKEKDVYDWSPMDKLLEKVAARGHQAVVRFRYTYPGYASAVPDYIKNLEGYEGRWAKADGRSKPDTEYPDWRCEELRRFHLEFHRRFAERYDKDPRLAFVETGFGHWAEYHVYDGKYIDGQTFPSKEFQAEFLPKMDEWFKETPWLISIDAADEEYAPFHEQKELKNLNFGNFDDSFMCKEWSGYNWSCWSFFGKERYKKAPAGGEFSYYTDSDQKHALDKAGMHGRVFEDMVAKVHMTFIIGNDQPLHQKPERITEAAMSMGYRFEVRDFKVLEGKSAEVLIANVGVAPIYRDAFVEVEGVRGDLNLRTLMPGDEALVTIACEAKTSSRPAIACDHLVQGQEIQYQADIKE